MGVVTNIRELKDLRRRAPLQNRAQIDKIIDLYSERKIGNFKTAENIVNRLSVKTNNPASKDKTKKIYDDIISKYGEAQSVTGRLDRETNSKAKKTYSVTMILFREPDEGDSKAKTVSINVDAGSKAQKRKIVEQAEDDIKQLRKQKSYSKLKQFYIGSFDIRLSKSEYDYLDGQTDSLIMRGDNKEFGRVTKMLADRNVIFGHLMDVKGNSYLKAIYLMNLSNSDTKGRAFEPKKAKNRDGHKMSCYYMYISTELDLSATTFKEAIEKQNYRSNECFLNSIYDHYHDSLLKDNHRNAITRQTLLDIIGKTEDQVKEGLSIEDVMPFFERFRLSLRVFDKGYKMIYKYDPPTRNSRAKAMYCMMSDRHIYTLDFKVNELQQEQNEDIYIVVAN